MFARLLTMAVIYKRLLYTCLIVLTIKSNPRCLEATKLHFYLFVREYQRNAFSAYQNLPLLENNIRLLFYLILHNNLLFVIWLAFYETAVGKFAIYSLYRTCKELNREIFRIILSLFFGYIWPDILGPKTCLSYHMGIYFVTLIMLM